MSCLVVAGAARAEGAWKERLEAHARRLGMRAVGEARDLRTGTRLSVTWLGPREPRAGFSLEESGGRLAFGFSEPWDRSRAFPLVEVDARSGEIVVSAPLGSPEQAFVREEDAGVVVTNDARLLAERGASLDERAAYALLQLGAIPAPLSPWPDVLRVPNGWRWRRAAGASSGGLERALPPMTEWPGIDPELAPEAFLERALDDVLGSVPEGAILYFSGGVDSGLMLARLVALGRRDLRLVNYAFGPADPEARVAAEMARGFGVPLERLELDLSGVVRMLERIPLDYTHPFSDGSSLPTHHLIEGSLGIAPGATAAVEGTGADGLFGVGLLHRPWSRLGALPRTARAALAGLLTPTRPWTREDLAERIWRVLRRSARLPLGEAVLAHNALDGIAYRTPPAVAAEIDEAIATRIDVFARGRGGADALSLFDLVHVCAGQFAAKSASVLRARGVQPIYPYLEPAVIEAAFALTWDEKCEGREPKALLKRMLARAVPPRLVYRPKSGFRPPLGAILGAPGVHDAARDLALSSRNPLLPLLERPILEDVFDRARHGRALPLQAINFAWVNLFSAAWWSGLNPPAR